MKILSISPIVSQKTQQIKGRATFGWPDDEDIMALSLGLEERYL
jgi:hypothetical protein